MRFPNPVLRTLGGLMLVGVVMVGCSAQRAESTISKAQVSVQQLEALQAGNYAPTEFDSIKNLLSQANQQLAGGQGGEALATAKNARQQAEGLLAQIRPQAANDARSAALKALEVADRNNGRSLDPALYDATMALRGEMETALNESEFEQAITKAREISSNVDRLVAPVKNKAESARINAENKLQELRSLNAARWAPDTEATSLRLVESGMTAMGEENRDYISAEQRFLEARAEAEAGITLVRRERSDFFIDVIERALADAFEEGAPTYMPTEYNRMVSELERQIADFNNELYEQVEAAVVPMADRANQLKLDVKERRSDANLAEIRRGIDSLVEAGAREYLPGRVEVVEQVLAEGQRIRSVPAGAPAEQREQAFDEIRSLHQRAMDQLASVDSAFSALASEALRLAGNQLQTTSSVFSEVEGIFQPMDQVPDDMRTFENARAARRTQFSLELEQARAALENARQDLARSAYRDAILGAEEQGRIANNLLGEIYRFVANNAVIDLSTLITSYERDGARVHAPRELEESQRELARLKEIIASGDFLLAAEVASATRANIELMAQRIAGRAVVDIRDARALLVEVDTPRVRQFSAAEIDQARALVREAELAVGGDSLQVAVEKAREAIRLALRAQENAYRAGAERALGAAQEAISRAQSSGAALYAGATVDRATRLFSSAQALAGVGDWKQAEELALASARAASDAFYAKVLEAEAVIEQARSLGAWDTQRVELTAAVSRASEARRMLDQGGTVTAANVAAEDARRQASAVVASARAQNYRDITRRIRQNLEQGRTTGMNFIQPDEAQSILRRLAEIQAQWDIDRYDPLMAELRLIEADLAGTLATTQEVVDTVVAQQSARLAFLVENDGQVFGASLLESAERNLRIAPLEFRDGNFRAAHRRLREAVSSLDEVQARLDHEVYVDQVVGLFQDFLTAQQEFRNVLTLSASEMKAVAFEPMARDRIVAMSGPMTVSQFRREMDRLYTLALRVDTPASMQHVHASVVEVFERARLSAAHFEKMIILNLTSEAEAERVIDEAYEEINRANRMAEGLKREYFSQEIRFRLVQAHP